MSKKVSELQTAKSNIDRAVPKLIADVNLIPTPDVTSKEVTDYSKTLETDYVTGVAQYGTKTVYIYKSTECSAKATADYLRKQDVEKNKSILTNRISNIKSEIGIINSTMADCKATITDLQSDHDNLVKFINDNKVATNLEKAQGSYNNVNSEIINVFKKKPEASLYITEAALSNSIADTLNFNSEGSKLAKELETLKSTAEKIKSSLSKTGDRLITKMGQFIRIRDHLK